MMNAPQEFLLRAVQALQRHMMVVSPDYTVLATKEDALGPYENTMVGGICHLLLFDNPSPCEACPAAEVQKTGRPAMPPDSTLPMEEQTCFYAFPIFGGNVKDGPGRGAMEAIAVMSYDVPVLKGLEDKLERSNAFLRNLIQSALDGVIAADMRGNMLMFNEVAAQITGYTAQEALTHINIADIYPRSVAHEVMGKLRCEDFGGKGKLKSYQVNVLTKQEDLVPISLDAAIVYEKGREVASIGIFHDLREELRMRSELEKAQVQLLQAEKMSSLGKLAAGVAHQLNNPIGGITLFASLLLEEYNLPEGAQKDVSRILKDAERCRDTIKELLEFARQTDHFVRPQDINKIIRRTLFLLKNQSLFQNIKTLDMLTEDLPQIPVDAQQMNHLFMNIILNAAQAMQGKGQLVLKSREVPEKGSVRIKISDTGPGIPKAILPNIFDPFYTTKEQGEGTGLGLSIVYGIIKNHKGQIKAVNRKEQGTSFIIELPLTAAEEKGD